ncbi:hypothetical protein BSG1_11111 [Bacillus sp. SG-1]|nr:hypothetical protein BSG1_11111 [Bacillus sp. SG-1]
MDLHLYSCYPNKIVIFSPVARHAVLSTEIGRPAGDRTFPLMWKAGRRLNHNLKRGAGITASFLWPHQKQLTASSISPAEIILFCHVTK